MLGEVFLARVRSGAAGLANASANGQLFLHLRYEVFLHLGYEASCVTTELQISTSSSRASLKLVVIRFPRAGTA